MMVALTIVHVILCVILVAVVLFQSGKQQGLSGSIGGGAETFFGKSKARTMDAILARCTTVIAVLFVITSIVLTILAK